MRISIGILVLGLFLWPLPAFAHHEALFGSQSSIVLSSDRYATAQVYTRSRGPKDDRTRETTTVLSGGFSPFRGPVSISVVVPFSVISSGGQSQTGIENAVFGARYRQDLPGLMRAWSGKGAYVMGAGQ